MTIDLDRKTGNPVEGIHLCKITEAKEQASQAGDPMVVITYTIQTAGEDQGKEFTNFYPITGKGRFRIEALLDAVKAPRKGQCEAGFFVGKVLRIGVQLQPYQGQMRANAFIHLAADSKENPIIPPFKEQESKGLPAGQKTASPKF